MQKKGFVTISIKIEDHERLTKWVTHKKKIYNVVAEALDALEKTKKK